MDRQSVVRDLDLLSALTLAVPLVPEKQGGTRQAVKLNYTDEFDFVQGALRGLLTVHSSSSSVGESPSAEAPSSSPVFPNMMQHPEFICDVSQEATSVEGTGMCSEEWAPVYLITQGVVIDKCGAHYGAWKLRRDLVTSPRLFEKCAIEKAQFPIVSAEEVAISEVTKKSRASLQKWETRYQAEIKSLPPPKATNQKMSNIRDFTWGDLNEFARISTESPSTKSRSGGSGGAKKGVVDRDDGDDESSFETVDSAEENERATKLDLQQERCASLAVVLPSIANGDFKDRTGTYCAWRAVAWELAQCKTFARMCHKNFQVWHHRRELIIFGCTVGGLSSLVDNISFSAVDERILCDQVLEEDSKNYHVWSHRCWFVSAFDELNSVDINRMVKRQQQQRTLSSNSGLSQPQQQHQKESVNATESDEELLEAIRQNAEKDNGSESAATATCEGVYVVGGLEEEFAFSAILIDKDVFNNSAWSYRMLLLKQFIVDRGFMATIKAGLVVVVGDDEERVLLLDTCEVLFRDVLAAEIAYAVYWASREVCNECPFTYARGVAELARGAIKAILGDIASVVDGESGTTLQREILQRFIRVFGDNSAKDPRQTDRRLIDSLPHMYVSHLLTSCVLPQAILVSEQAKDPSTPYGKRTAFVRNNTHQCIAGMYHSAFDAHIAYWNIADLAPISVGTGCTAFIGQSSQTEQHQVGGVRAHLQAALHSSRVGTLLSSHDILRGPWSSSNASTWASDFTQQLRKVAEGVAIDAIDSASSSTATIQLPCSSDLVEWVYSHLLCLALGRILTCEDTIRFKYWKAQVHDLLHFRMLA